MTLDKQLSSTPKQEGEKEERINEESSEENSQESSSEGQSEGKPKCDLSICSFIFCNGDYCYKPTKYGRFMKKNEEDITLEDITPFEIEDLPDALDFEEYDGEDSYEESGGHLGRLQNGRFFHYDDAMWYEDYEGEEEAWASLLDVDKYETMDIEYVPDTKGNYRKAYEMVSKGQFKEAVEFFFKLFYFYRYALGWKREFLALYLSGLQVEMKRREIEDDVQSLQMAKYFASLNLKPSHHFLAKSNYVLVCLKKGNLKEAKRVALEIKEGGGQIIKEVSKALEIEGGEDKYDLPPGKFCYDILNVSLDYKVCMYCSTANKEGSHCSLCKVGKLK